MLKQRVITAAFLVPVVLMSIYATKLVTFAQLSAVLMLFALIEWLRLARIHALLQRIGVLSLFVLCVWFFYLTRRATILPLLTASCLYWLWALSIVYRFPAVSQASRPFVTIAQLALLTLGAWAAMIFLKFHHGSHAVLLLFLLVYMADSCAYFAGRLWGQRKLAPALSPGKSWAGVYGAFASGLLVSLLACAIWPWSWQQCFGFIILSILTVAMSIVGDLYESYHKRISGVKDSGQLLPGHGGILDRIDSLLAAAPFFALGVHLLGIQL